MNLPEVKCLNANERLIFFGIILACAESRNETLVLSERSLYEMGTQSNRVQNALGSLQEFQLLSVCLKERKKERKNKIYISKSSNLERNADVVPFKKPDSLPPQKISDAERLEARMKFDFKSLFEGYPKPECRTEAIRLMTEELKTPEDYEKAQRAISNFAKKIRDEEREYKFIPIFRNFWPTWREYIDFETESARKQRETIAYLREKYELPG